MKKIEQITTSSLPIKYSYWAQSCVSCVGEFSMRHRENSRFLKITALEEHDNFRKFSEFVRKFSEKNNFHSIDEQEYTKTKFGDE